ncbi:MAG TPA: transcriptional regulator [Clostridiales bacterium]|nr:transcriptional regulator [Clostridiales bacterium]
MEIKGIRFDVQHVAPLDPGFMPFGVFSRAFLKTAKKPLAIAVEEPKGSVSVFDTFIHGTPEMREADEYYVERVVKCLLWMRGGFRVSICGEDSIAGQIASMYSKTGKRAFDFDFMSGVYERDLEVVSLPYTEKPREITLAKSVGRNMDGYRIGFDAGGSDRKVSAMINGEVIFTEETVWYPKLNADPQYHLDGIMDSFRKAAEKMKRVDGIGVSSAGVYIDNKTRVASLFIKVPKDVFEKKVKNIYQDAAKMFGDIPVEVCNDGDVTALAGAMSLEDDSVLGIAMGTSEAGGYVDSNGNITGWLNELAFVPVDAQPGAMKDEWSGDIGCGVKYFSQDAVIKLGPAAGISFEEGMSPAEKLAYVQQLMINGDKRPVNLYKTLGVYLGYGLAHYADYYTFKHVLLLGRVMSGEGGMIMYNQAKDVLKDEFPEICCKLHLPDEKTRRVGQSAAAASLPKIKR